MASRRPALGFAALLLALAAPATVAAEPVVTPPAQATAAAGAVTPPVLATAAAAGPTVAPTVPCVRYVGTTPPAPTLGINASGFAAGAALTFKVDGKPVGTGVADALGAFVTGAGPLTPPEPKYNVQSFTLSAEDATGAVATAPFKIVRLTVDVPDRAKPSQKVRYRAFGFQPGKRLYLFVRRGGTTRGRFALGKVRGDCGQVTKRLRYMPLKHWSTGRYEYWYSQSRTYSKKTRIYGYQIRIFKSVG